MAKIGIWDTFVSERPSAAIPPKPERLTKQRVSKKAQARAAEPRPVPAPEPVRRARAGRRAEPAAEAVPDEQPVEAAAEETSEA